MEAIRKFLNNIYIKIILLIALLSLATALTLPHLLPRPSVADTAIQESSK